MLIGIDASRATGERLTGTERYSREVIAALIRIAPHHRFRLYVRDSAAPPVPDATGAMAPTADGHVETVCVQQARLWTHVGLARELAERPPDALFVPAHVLPASFARAEVRRAIRSVVTVHDVGYRHFPGAHPLAQRGYLDFGTRFSVAQASVVVVDSHATLNDVRRFYGVPEARLRVAYPGQPALPEATGADIDRALQRFELSGAPFILHVGTLQPRKNLRRLVAAWARAERPREARLVLAGAAGWGGDANQLKTDAAALGVAESVRVLGYVSDVEKAALLHSARGYIFPSLYEGFGFPVLEAQSAGLPIACSDTSSLPEVAGDAALLFDPLSTEQIAVAIGALLAADAVRAELIERGWRNLGRFSWDNCARAVLGALEGQVG